MLMERPLRVAFALSLNCRLHYLLHTFLAAGPLSLKDRALAAAPDFEPAAFAFCISAGRHKSRSMSFFLLALRSNMGLDSPICLIRRSFHQNRHRMLSSDFLGSATSVTRNPKFPLTRTTSPRATILSPTIRSTGSETWRSSC